MVYVRVVLDLVMVYVRIVLNLVMVYVRTVINLVMIYVRFVFYLDMVLIQCQYKLCDRAVLLTTKDIKMLFKFNSVPFGFLTE